MDPFTQLLFVAFSPVALFLPDINPIFLYYGTLPMHGALDCLFYVMLLMNIWPICVMTHSHPVDPPSLDGVTFTEIHSRDNP